MNWKGVVIGLMVVLFAATGCGALEGHGGEGVSATPYPGPENLSTGGKSVCDSISDELHKQNEALHREIRQLKREILMLRQEVSSPDVRDIIGGIGFVFGLCGVGFYFHARAMLKKGRVE
ncbi:bZIP transcription factor [Thermodesulforhabdus norvegica]|nr:bZIP transcription factor [Thermodesulforhabdus norvegica]